MHAAKKALYAAAFGLLLLNTVACTKLLSAVLPAIAATCGLQ